MLESPAAGPGKFRIRGLQTNLAFPTQDQSSTKKTESYTQPVGLGRPAILQACLAGPPG